MLISATVKNEERKLSLYEQIEAAKAEIARLRSIFDCENDPELMDEIIFKLCAAESKFSALMDEARKKAS